MLFINVFDKLCRIWYNNITTNRIYRVLKELTKMTRNLAGMSIKELKDYEKQLSRELSKVRAVLNRQTASAKFPKPKSPEYKR